MILKVLKVLTKVVSDYYGVDDDADNDDYKVLKVLANAVSD